MHIRHLLISSLAAVSWGFVAAVSAVFYLPMLITEAITSVRWEMLFDARTSLAMDGMAQRTAVADDPERSTFRSFIERALSHDLFVAGKFDPGRAAA